MTSEPQQNFAAIRARMLPANGAALDEPVHQLDRAVMLDLQPPRHFADSRPGIHGEAFQSQQQLMLLWLEAMRSRRFGAELEEAANLVAEFRQRSIFSRRQINNHIYIVARYKYTQPKQREPGHSIPGLAWRGHSCLRRRDSSRRSLMANHRP
jgi:hypothetical protein